MLGTMVAVRSLTISVPDQPHPGSLAPDAARVELQARLSGAGPLAVIAPPHPLYGGTIDNPVVRAIVRAYLARGNATLAFNFRGTGESTGTQGGGQQDALVDYLAAARSQRTPLASLAGYSFGSVAALAAAVELAAPHVLMVGPALGLLALHDSDLLERYQGVLSVVLGDDDEYAPVADVRRLFEGRPRTALQVLPGVDHFFLGSAVTQLSEALGKLPLGET
jgi:uncharacterized protein